VPALQLAAPLQVSSPLQAFPSEQLVVERTPDPQVTTAAPLQEGAKSSSELPSQSSSLPSQLASSAAAGPGVHESTTLPPTQLVLPEAWQAPMPHEVCKAT
jgi:hypothetical protein